jgi:MATE family multidrug resistance protein
VKSIREEATATLRLGGPLIVAQLAQMSISFIDAVMAGNLSPKDLAAIAVGSSIEMTVWMVSIGLLLSINPTIAHLFGAGERERIGSAARQGLWFASAISIVAFFAVRQARLIMTWTGVSPEFLPIALGYLNAISWSMPAMCGFQALRSFSEGVSITKPVLYATLIGLFGHITGNTIFMYGKLGAPRLGAVGCGVAGAISVWMMFGFMVFYVRRHAQYAPFGLFSKFEGPHWTDIRALIRLGAPTSASLFMEVSLFSVFALLIGSMGTTAVAGHVIALNVASLTFMIPMGLAMAITVRVGQAMGRGDPVAARFAGFTGIGLAAAFMACTAAVMLTFPGRIAGIYTEDPAVRDMAAHLLLMAAVFQISDGLQVSASGALRGMKDTRRPMLITFIAYWIIAFPLGYFLGIVRGGGPHAMWIGFIVGLTVAAILLNARFCLLTRHLTRQ